MVYQRSYIKVKASAYFGGEFYFDKMNFFEKLIVKKISKIPGSMSKIDQIAIKSFSKKMDEVFNPFLYLV